MHCFNIQICLNGGFTQTLVISNDLWGNMTEYGPLDYKLYFASKKTLLMIFSGFAFSREMTFEGLAAESLTVWKNMLVKSIQPYQLNLPGL